MHPFDKGWKRDEIERKNGKYKGRVDVYIKSPNGRIFRSRTELESFLNNNNLPYKIEDFYAEVKKYKKETTKSPTSITSDDSNLTKLEPRTIKYNNSSSSTVQQAINNSTCLTSFNKNSLSQKKTLFKETSLVLSNQEGKSEGQHCETNNSRSTETQTEINSTLLNTCSELLSKQWISDNTLQHYFDALNTKLLSSKSVLILNIVISMAVKSCDEYAHFLADVHGLETNHLLIIPINDATLTAEANSGGSHWSVLVLDKQKNSYYYFDSFGNHNLQHATIISEKITCYFNLVKPTFKIIDCAQQKNGYDCAVFTVYFIESILMNVLSGQDVDLKQIESMEINELSLISKRLTLAYIVNNWNINRELFLLIISNQHLTIGSDLENGSLSQSDQDITMPTPAMVHSTPKPVASIDIHIPPSVKNTYDVDFVQSHKYCELLERYKNVIHKLKVREKQNLELISENEKLKHDLNWLKQGEKNNLIAYHRKYKNDNFRVLSQRLHTEVRMSSECAEKLKKENATMINELNFYKARVEKWENATHVENLNSRLQNRYGGKWTTIEQQNKCPKQTKSQSQDCNIKTSNQFEVLAENSFQVEKEEVRCSENHEDNTVARRSKHRVLIVSDSHGRDLRKRLQISLNEKVDVTAVIRPGAPFSAVTSDLTELAKDFSKDDHVIILGGTNDITARGGVRKEVNMNPIAELTKTTNVTVSEVPFRFKNKNQSQNFFVHQSNLVLCSKLKNLKNIGKLVTTDLDRTYFGYDGLHLNNKGKGEICKRIVKAIEYTFLKAHGNKSIDAKTDNSVIQSCVGSDCSQLVSPLNSHAQSIFLKT